MRAHFSLLLGTLLITSQALGQDLLDYQLKPAVQQGKGLPQVILTAQNDFRSVDLLCARDGGPEGTQRGGAMKRGQNKAFNLNQGVGEAHWECTGRAWYGAGPDDHFDLPMAFDAFLGPALSIEVPRPQIDKPRRRAVVKSNRSVARAHVTIVGVDGPAYDADVDVAENQAGEDVELRWEGPEEILRLDITLFDKWGFNAFENISPWSLEIPHEDVEFDTAKHEIRADQAPRLDKAAGDIAKIVERYGKYVTVKLYLGGYTDTVGSREDNQGLSERRARGIAQALRQRGFKGPIYYQGFGEDGLCVATDEGVDMQANRRAVYLLASESPATGPNFPRSAWKPL